MRPPRHGRRWWLAGLGAVLAVGAAIAVPVVSSGSPAPSVSAADYRIVTPPNAGGWRISTSGPDGLTLADLEASRMQRLVDGKAQHGVASFYTDPATGTTVIFDGASGPLGDPADLIARLRADPTQITTLPGAKVTWHEVDPGPHGGRAACGDVTDPSLSPLVRVPFCVWQTTTSFGQLTQLPNGPGPGNLTADALADLMRRMRPDLETAA